MQITSKQITESIIALFWLTFALFLVKKVLIGGFFNMLWLVGVLILTTFFFLLKHEKKWHGLALGLLPGTLFTFNAYGMSSINFSFLFTLFVILVIFSHAIFKKRDMKRSEPRKVEDFIMFLILGYVSIRLIYDRPGLIAFGAGEGGLMLSLFFWLGAAGFFAYKALCFRIKPSLKNLNMVIFFGILIEIHQAFRSVQIGQRMWFQELAGFPSWMLLPILLVFCLEKRKKLGFHFWAISSFFLLLGLVADHRTRLFFMAGIILLIAFFYKRFRRAFITLAIIGTIGIGGMVGSGHVPDVVRRPLSIIFPSIAAEGTDLRYGRRAVGFKDDFRARLYRMAWKEIKQHPILGKGVGLNVYEALDILAGDRSDNRIGMLALSGSYHNTYVSVAVKLGLPIAFLFLWISFAVPIRLGRSIYNHPDTANRQLSVILIAFLFGVIFFASINGGHKSFYIISIVLGYMSYLHTQIMKEKMEKNFPTDSEISFSLSKRAMLKTR